MVTRQIDFKDGNKTILKDAMTLTADWKVTPRLVLSLTGIYTIRKASSGTVTSPSLPPTTTPMSTTAATPWVATG
jgi:hypothetical protein